MKYFIVVVIIAYIALKQDVMCDSIGKMANRFTKECLNETQVDAVVMSSVFLHGKFSPEDNKMQDYFLCLFKKIGFLNETGEFDPENTKELVSAMPNHTGSIIEACTNEPQGNGRANAMHLAKCFYKTHKLANKV